MPYLLAGYAACLHRVPQLNDAETHEKEYQERREIGDRFVGLVYVSTDHCADHNGRQLNDVQNGRDPREGGWKGVRDENHRRQDERDESHSEELPSSHRNSYRGSRNTLAGSDAPF